MSNVNVLELAKPAEQEAFEGVRDGLAAEQQEIRGRAEARRAELAEKRAELEALEAERRESLAAGESVKGLRGKRRALEQEIEDLEAETAELEEAAGSWDAKIRAADVKVAQARHGTLIAEGEKLRAKMAKELAALRETVAEFERVRGECYECHRFIRQANAQAPVAGGIGGRFVNHRYWQNFVPALEATETLDIAP